MLKKILAQQSRKGVSAPMRGKPIITEAPAAEGKSVLWKVLEEAPKPIFNELVFIRKLEICCVPFDFTDPVSNAKEEEVRREILLELVNYVSNVSTDLNEETIEVITRMVAANIFRALRSSTGGERTRVIFPTSPSSTDEEGTRAVEGFDVEEVPTKEPAWQHLQIVYEFFLKFLASVKTDTKIAKHYINHSFILRLLDLFDSEDSRERENLKTILHRIYGKFMVHRAFIRKAINNVLYQFIFETEKHNGIDELLAVLDAIIRGFVNPLKEEHRTFLGRVLIPLHKPKCFNLYHRNLSSCLIEFIKKDRKLASTVILGMLKYWPLSNSTKELLFLSELKEVLQATEAPEFQKCMVPLFRQIAKCLSSLHFQVAEQAINLWSNDHILSLITQNLIVILPIIIPALESNAQGHWKQSVHELTINLVNRLLDIDQELFEECLHRFQDIEVVDTRMKKLDIAASKAFSTVFTGRHDSTGADELNLPQNQNTLQLSVSPSSISLQNDTEALPPMDGKGSKEHPAMEDQNITGQVAVYELLPSFNDLPSSKKVVLFLQKLEMCCMVFDFSTPMKNAHEKEVKQQMLLELSDYVNSSNTKFSKEEMREATKMVAVNIFRTLPPSTVDKRARVIFQSSSSTTDDNTDDKGTRAVDGFDLEEVPSMEPAWPHLQIIYEFFFRFITSAGTDAKIAKRYVDRSFILQLIDLFDSEDPREREWLKKILHLIYGKFMVHRIFIRKAINNVFYQFIFETEKHNGIEELLAVIDAIIRGFVNPLKEEHVLFLNRVLIPLHKPKCFELYHQNLSFCIIDFIKKDNKLADTVVRGMLKYWPISNSTKEVLFLSELKEILEATEEPVFQKFMVPLFWRVAKCLISSHCEVAEQALYLCSNENVATLIINNIQVLLPIILPALERNVRGYWNQAVQAQSQRVMNLLDTSEIFMDYSIEFHEYEEMLKGMPVKLKSTSIQSDVSKSTAIIEKVAQWRDTGREDRFSLRKIPSPLQHGAESTKPFCFKWEPPPKGWVKVNFAGVVREGNRAGAGALIRDSRGYLLCAVAVELNTYSLPSCEFRGAWEGLRIASTFEGYDGIWLEGYSQRVITWVEKALQAKTTTKYKAGLIDILHWITSFSDCRCTHIYREGNKPADFLAGLGLSTSSFFTCEEDVPSELSNMVKQDKEGLIYTVDDPWVRNWMEWSGPSMFRRCGSSGRSSLRLDLPPFDSE